MPPGVAIHVPIQVDAEVVVATLPVDHRRRSSRAEGAAWAFFGGKYSKDGDFGNFASIYLSLRLFDMNLACLEHYNQCNPSIITVLLNPAQSG